MIKIIVAVCLAAVVISSLLFFSGSKSNEGGQSTVHFLIDSSAIESAIESYTDNKYLRLDIIALMLASDERYLTEENKDILVAMHNYVQSNPQLLYASRRTKIDLNRITPFGDSTVYEASVEELDFNAVSKIALSDVARSKVDDNEKLIQKFINIVLTNDTLPTVVSNSRYAVVRSKCNLKIFPIPN